MQFLFLSLSRSELAQSADLTPPFYPNERNHIGFWNVGGSAFVEEEKIVLVPPIQYRKGSIWSTLPLPYGEWSITYKLSVSEGNGGGGFSIPLISQHAGTGDLYGGPTKFKGCSFVGAVFANNKGDPELHYKAFLSNGDEEFKVLGEHDQCTNIIPLTDDPFEVTLHVSNEEVSLEHKAKGKEPVTVIKEKLTVDISRCWLGITAMCDDYTSKITFYSAVFNTEDYIQKRIKESRNMQNMPSESEVHPKVIQRLRNPSFAIMRKEIKMVEEKKGELDNTGRTIDDFMNVVDEFGEVMTEVCTYGQLNEFIGKTLIPYSESWHRRTFKVMDTVAKTKDMINNSFNETKALLEIFNETVSESMDKAKAKIGDIKTILLEESESELLDWFTVSKENPLLGVLKFIAIGEVVAVVLFYVIQRNTKFNEMLMK